MVALLAMRMAEPRAALTAGCSAATMAAWKAELLVGQKVFRKVETKAASKVERRVAR